MPTLWPCQSGLRARGGRKKDEAEQTTCVALATLVQPSNRHFRYLNSLRAGNICLNCYLIALSDELFDV